MSFLAINVPLLALIDGWHVLVITDVIPLLFGIQWLARRKWPNRRAFLDQEAEEGGKALGGIFGKPAAEALTPKNEVAELYKPEALERGNDDTSSVRRAAAFRQRRSFWRTLLHLLCGRTRPEI